MLCLRWKLPRATGRAARCARNLCSISSAHERLQPCQVKASEFYVKNALDLNYFYHVDVQGRLYMEDCVPKNADTKVQRSKILEYVTHKLTTAMGHITICGAATFGNAYGSTTPAALKTTHLFPR